MTSCLQYYTCGKLLFCSVHKNNHILVHPKRVIRRNIPDDSKVLETKNQSIPTSKDKYIIQHYVNVPTVRPIIQDTFSVTSVEDYEKKLSKRCLIKVF